MDAPIELHASYTTQSSVDALGAVRTPVYCHLLEDLDGLAQVFAVITIAIKMILVEADCIAVIRLASSEATDSWRHLITVAAKYKVNIVFKISAGSSSKI